MHRLTIIFTFTVLCLVISFQNARGQAGKPGISVDTVRLSSHYWEVHVRDTAAADKFIYDAEYLIDPLGVVKKRPNADTGYTSYNVSSDPPTYTVPPGQKTVDVNLAVDDLRKRADVWFWAVNGAGGDSLVHLVYTPPLWVSVDTICDAQPKWLAHITDTAEIDDFIFSVELLDVKGQTSYNVSFEPGSFSVPAGRRQIDANIVVQNPLRKAEAWLSITNGAGFEIRTHLTYVPPALQFGAGSANAVDSDGFARLNFAEARVGMDTCSRFVFKNVSTGGMMPLHLTQLQFLIGAQGFTAVPVDLNGTPRSLPITMDAGDSVIIQICFNTSQKGYILHDTLYAETECPAGIGFVSGSTLLPEITASDWDFGNVEMGTSSTHSVRVSNTGKASFTLTKEWTTAGYGAYDFSLIDSAKLPLMLLPGSVVDLKVQYAPSTTGRDSAVFVWRTDMATELKSSKKNYSILKGQGSSNASVNSIAAKMLIVRPNPVSDMLTVDIPDSRATIPFEVFDLVGNRLMKLPATDNKIDVHGLAPGVYYLRATTTHGILTRRFVKK